METTWAIDSAHTSVEFSAKHMMITTVKGRLADVTGSIVLSSDKPADAKVDAVMKAASIDTRSEQRDAHLRSNDFLDVENFPEVAFHSTGIDGVHDAFKLTGDLTIRGVTKPITLDVSFEGEGKDPWGGQRMGFAANGKFDRRDFGLVYNQALETGGFLVSNEIKIQIDTQLTRQA